MFEYLKTIPLTLSISIVTLIVFAFPALAEALEFHTSIDSLDQRIQLFGCHLLHWTNEHLFWDLTMFAVLGAICERLNRSAYALALLASATLIPPIASLFHPDIETYRGLSGIDSALFGLAVISMGLECIRRGDRAGSLTYIGLLGAMILKIGHELVTGNTFFVESAGFSPVPVAHVVGGTIGVLFGLAAWFIRSRSSGIQTVGGPKVDPAI